MNKQKTKGWFLPLHNIDDIFISHTDGKNHEATVTIFYHDFKERDKEVNFIMILN